MPIPVPEGTSSIYLTALSLYDNRLQYRGLMAALFGASFTGPTDSFVLNDKVFGLPIVSLTDNFSNEISVSFKHTANTTSEQSSVTKHVGPQGNGTAKPWEFRLPSISRIPRSGVLMLSSEQALKFRSQKIHRLTRSTRSPPQSPYCFRPLFGAPKSRVHS
ncbi:hypothetical protein JHW43_001326 [Diplocarpon mali]|nr:hypothetical protein JHW43_001326 [Diplocarpon mali]